MQLEFTEENRALIARYNKVWRDWIGTDGGDFNADHEAKMQYLYAASDVARMVICKIEAYESCNGEPEDA